VAAIALEPGVVFLVALVVVEPAVILGVLLVRGQSASIGNRLFKLVALDLFSASEWAPRNSKMIGRHLSFLLLTLFGLAGCSPANFQAGRQALLRGDPNAAVAYLDAAVEESPNYVNVIQNYRESIWTYLGRAQYETKRYPEARSSLEKGFVTVPDDAMAKLYLGLTAVRNGDITQGTKQIEEGLKSIDDWIEYMNRSRPFQAFWDPMHTIRKQIDQDLTMLSAREFNGDQIVGDAEWIGKMFEEELDRVRDDERREFERNNERDHRGFR
jgi:tetratricopeptide (TPR) repeat protein